MIDSDKNKQKILKNFIKIAEISGWNDKSLKKACLLSDIDPDNLIFIFPDSVLDVAQLYLDNGNNLLIKEIAKIKDFNKKKIRDKIRLCLYKRFEIEIANRQILINLSNFYQDPKNLTNFENGLRPAMQSITFSFIIADLIWSILDDQSSDFNYYTKRLILAKIIVRSFFIFIKDDMKDIAKTKSFIDLQIEKVMKFEKFKFKSKEVAQSILESVQDCINNEDGSLKNIDKLIKDLPFIRLLKKND
ncbi:MAG: COQ9 family protein [Rickettsiales bacterium]|nr:COQ9 family protein [Rickettsiales bacterium]|tara:strand:+ start:575 stop:1312 length:738 start_codon:yes stop_codon:yes gene_type:complete